MTMQSKAKIRHRIRLLKLRHLEKEIRTRTSRQPANCLYNRVIDGAPSPVRVCSHKAKGWCGAVCDPRYNGDKIAARCIHFTPAVSAIGVKDDFELFFKNSTMPEFASRFPDITALLWVLGEAKNSPDFSDDVIEVVIDPTELGHLPYTFPFDPSISYQFCMVTIHEFNL